MKRVLLFFTASYPYGAKETFISYEVKHLCDRFDKVIIVPESRSNGKSRPIPDNASVVNINSNLNTIEKIMALKGFSSPLYKNEVAFVKKVLGLKVDWKIRKILLTSLYKAKKFEKFINGHTCKDSKLNLYTYWMNDMAAACAYAKMKNPSLFFISRAHGWDVYYERHSPPYLPLRNFITTYCDKICFVSAQGLRYFSKKNKTADTNNLEVSYLGTNRINAQKKRSTDPRFHIVSCSDVIPLKQVEKLAESISKVKTEKPVKWTHIGSGPEFEKVKKLTLALFANKPHLSCHFTGGISNKEVHEILASGTIDIFVNASSYEGLPVSLMEALSYGIPVLAPNVGGMAELIDPDKNGFLFSKNPTTEEITSSISKLINMPEKEYEKMREAAILKWQKNFYAEKNFRLFMRYFK